MCVRNKEKNVRAYIRTYLPRYHGDFFYGNMLCSGTKYYANLEIMSCQVLFFGVFCSLKLWRRQAKQTLESTTPKIRKNNKYRLEIMSILEFITLCRPTRYNRRLESTSSIYNILQPLTCLAQPPSAFTSRCGTNKAGRGALEPLPEDGAQTKRFDREIPVSRIPY